MFDFILAIGNILSLFSAEARATEWWSERYCLEGGSGAVWYDDEVKRWYVGICDGKSDKPGKGGRVIPAMEGGFYNRTWEAKFQSPDGRYYKNASWFGYGETPSEAFYQACVGGHCPMKNGKHDLQEELRFLKSIGKDPIKRNPIKD